MSLSITGSVSAVPWLTPQMMIHRTRQRVALCVEAVITIPTTEMPPGDKPPGAWGSPLLIAKWHHPRPRAIIIRGLAWIPPLFWPRRWDLRLHARRRGKICGAHTWITSRCDSDIPTPLYAAGCCLCCGLKFWSFSNSLPLTNSRCILGFADGEVEGRRLPNEQTGDGPRKHTFKT